MSGPDRRTSPYQGMMAFGEGDADYFFGRDADRAIIASNLIASRLTLLYGPSGVGKSSVLLAGVATHVRATARRGLVGPGTPEFAFVVFGSWSGRPVEALLAAAREAVGKALGREPGAIEDPADLVRSLDALSRELGGTLLIVLDQFEEYFLYHGRDEGDDSFAAQFARAVNRPDLRVNFLVAIREDMLARLDRFEATIPGLFDNYLRLDRLDRDGAREAITRPIGRFLEDYGPGAGPSEIEAALVDEVLDKARAREAELVERGRGVAAGLEDAADSDTEAIETAYLQLVMERLWAEEARLGSRMLRLQTLNGLGGVRGVVRRHLDEVLGRLDRDERRVAEAVIPYLVTPSGTKIAMEPAHLARLTGQPPERVASTLGRLTRSESRVLRKAEGPDRSEGYEIFHDVLARVLLDYVAVLEAERSRAQVRKRGFAIAGLGAGFLLAVLLVGLALWQWNVAERARAKADHNANEAKIAKEGAERSAEEARVAKAAAEREAKVANSRRLAALANSKMDRRFDLGLLLAVEACRTETVEAQRTLLSALRNQPHPSKFFLSHHDIHAVAFSPDGKRLAAGAGGAFGGEVVVWELDSGARSALPDPPRDFVQSVAFSPDGKRLAVAGDVEVAVWEMVTYQSLGTIALAQPGNVPLEGISALAFRPGGQWLATGGKDRVILWDLRIESWKTEACRIANRNLSKQEWDLYIGADVPYHRTCPDLPDGEGVTPTAASESKGR